MRKIILDCDPGHDDALALLLANANPNIKLLAVTTVAGNQTLAKVTLNARRVMTLAGIRATPLAAGADRPLVREPHAAEDIHGASGLDGYDFPESTVAADRRNAVDLILELLHREDGITLVPTGPLTNIALVLRRDPQVIPKIREIVLMGGACGRGNVTPAAEFNIWHDAEAADIVFHSGVPLTMVGLDLTHQALATPEVMRRIASLKSEIARMAEGLIQFFASTYRSRFGFEAPPVHDPCAVARVISPDIMECRPMSVEIETRGTWTYGATVCDFHGVTGRPPNAQVALKLNVETFWDLMIDALASYS